MAKVRDNRRRVHANCGGELEFILKPSQVQTLIRCKKCGESEMQDYLSKE